VIHSSTNGHNMFAILLPSAKSLAVYMAKLSQTVAVEFKDLSAVKVCAKVKDRDQLISSRRY